MLVNTSTRYGAVARFFHWSIALLVLADIALGLVGKFTPRTGETAGFLQLLYSTHKTIGVLVLGLAVLRVLWAISQPRPVPIHPERRAETFAAETAHWLLYVAIFVLPLSGWVMHSAEVGFAPIWWPFGQNLPFVPKSEGVAETAAAIHWIAGIVLVATVAAHIGGALKHAVVDRDATLARMVRGTAAGTPENGGLSHVVAAFVAFAIWVVSIGGVVVFFAPTHSEETGIQSEAVQGEGWIVQDGSVSITVVQIGAPVVGVFTNWQAAIEYDPESGGGQVTAIIDTTSLALGSVTDQAKGPEFFDVEAFSQATYQGEIARNDGERHNAAGELTLVGQVVPVSFEFNLEVTDGVAVMSGATTLDRRDFGMGAAYSDESSVGFGVDVAITLTATAPE
ncbi:MAG TPA: cytochrome B [Octadecabacter sp.]|nr:cytochrome B [Octadecabacter sp.]